MASYYNAKLHDQGLGYLAAHGTHLYICAALPATYAQASLGYALAVKAGPVLGAPSALSPSGRRVTVGAVTDGVVTTTGTASHWAIVDATASELLVADTLDAAKPIGAGNSFTLSSFAIGEPDPA